MTNDNPFNLNYALLSWTRIKYSMSKCIKNEALLKNDLVKLENCLSAYGFEQLQILNNTEKYYEIEFFKDGILGVKQFPAEDIESAH